MLETIESADLGNFVVDAVAEICKWFSSFKATDQDASGRRGAKMKIQIANDLFLQKIHSFLYSLCSAFLLAKYTPGQITLYVLIVIYMNCSYFN